MADEIEKTPVLGLNMPPKGYFNWDEPLNENWKLLDSLGGGRLPFMTPLPMEHKLSGADAIGWALQGSVLDGDEYPDAWKKLSEAQERSSTVTKEYYDVTYTMRVDRQTGWVFVDKANYDKGVENLKHSLGFVVDYVEGNKRIILPYKECYWKFGSSAGEFIPQSLPNIKGTYRASRNVWTNPVVTGAFAPSDYIGSDGSDYGSNGGNYNIKFDASLHDETYQDDADVNPFASTVYLYYKVADMAAEGTVMDLSSMTKLLEALDARVKELEEKEEE